MRDLRLNPLFSDGRLATWESKFLHELPVDFKKFTYLDLDENVEAKKPSGELLAKVVRKAIPSDLFEETLPILREVGGDAAYRKSASGDRKQPGAVSGVMGFYPRTGRYGRMYCRAAGFTQRKPGKFERVLPLAHVANEIYAREAPAYFSAQCEVVVRTHPAWMIPGTAFTTLTVNRNWQTALHNDPGDLSEGRGVLACSYSGGLSGGELVLMKYGLVIPLGTGDAVIYDTSEFHCNLPLKGDGERISCVFYFLKLMQLCGSPREELDQLKHRKPGTPLFKSPAKPSTATVVPAPAATGVAQPTPLGSPAIDLVSQKIASDANGPVRSVQIRIATLEDQELLKSWCAHKTAPQIARKFPSVWRRFQYWGTYPPAIAVHGDQVVGFYAATFCKSTGYCNLYYICVDNKFKRLGIGKQMMEHAIARSKALGMSRWKNKSHIGSDGESFFSKHLGIHPVGLQGKEVVYDWSLEGVAKIEDIRERSTAGILLQSDKIATRRISWYARHLNKALAPIPGLALVGGSTASFGTGASGAVSIHIEPSAQTQRKVVLAIIGGSASGKTTLRRQFTAQDQGADTRSAVQDCWFANRFECCGQLFKKDELDAHRSSPGLHDPKQGVRMPVRVSWTVFPNCAVCGNPGTGADSNGNLEAINFALDQCLKERDLVIFDGVMSSKKLIDHLQNHSYSNLAVLWVYLDVNSKTVLARLKKRREERGATEASDKTVQGVLNFRKRAQQTWEYVTAFSRKPASFFVVPEGKSPEEIYSCVRAEVAKVFNSPIGPITNEPGVQAENPQVKRMAEPPLDTTNQKSQQPPLLPSPAVLPPVRQMFTDDDEEVF